MYCENCGHELADNSTFCSNCGKQVSKSEVVDNINNINNNANNNANNNVYSNIMPLNGPSTGYQQPMAPYHQQPYVQSPYIQPQPTIVNVQPAMNTNVRTVNGFCVASFVTSIAGFFIGALICGIAATVFGIIGIATYDEDRHNAKWMALTGIVLGVIDVIVGIFLVSIIAVLWGY